MSNVLVLDAEIKKAILKKGERPLPAIQYCDGFRDFKNMGMSILGGYQSWNEKYRVWDDSQQSVDSCNSAISESEHVLTFNGRAFDGPLLSHNCVDIPESKHVDLLVAIWAAHDLGDEFRYPSHAGFGLDACALANDIPQKTGNGALAPVWYQEGLIAKVTDYCLHDVWITLRVARLCLAGHFISPKTGKTVKVKLPFSSL